MAAKPAKPRPWGTPWARFRLAYNLYGWHVLLVCLLVVPVALFLVWITVTRGNAPVIPAAANTARGFGESDNDVFSEEVLFAAAHRYVAEHNGHLPDSSAWQTALHPYLARAGAINSLAPFVTTEGTARFVMNRAASSATLTDIPNANRTLLFWQAVTNQPDLPMSAYQKASAPFGGVTCEGTTYYLLPTGKADEPLLWQPTLHTHSSDEPPPK